MDDMKDVMEWIDSVRYAHSLCEQLKSEGYNVRYKHYSLDDGRIGLHINLYDSHGHLFMQYASGVFKSFDRMVEVLDYIANKIRQDVHEHNLLCVVDEYERTGYLDMKEVNSLIKQKKSIDKTGQGLKNHIFHIRPERIEL